MGGACNLSCGCFSTVGAGCKNSACAIFSGVLGGASNTASAAYSTVAGGKCNTACACYSFAAGECALGYLYGQTANSTGGFSTIGAGQISYSVAWREAVMNANANVDMSLDGTGTTNLLIPNGNNRGWSVYVDWLIVVTALGTGTSGGLVVGAMHNGTDSFFFKRVGGTASISAQTNIASHSDTGMSTSNMLFAVGGSNNLQITMNAPGTAGTGSTLRGMANVRLVEVAW